MIEPVLQGFYFIFWGEYPLYFIDSKVHFPPTHTHFLTSKIRMPLMVYGILQSLLAAPMT